MSCYFLSTSKALSAKIMFRDFAETGCKPVCHHHNMTVMHLCHNRCAAAAGATEEDDGWLLVTVHDALAVKGQLVILDARSLSKGPIATINLPHFLPAALHGSFSGDVWGPTSDTAPKWMEPNVVRAL